VEKGGPAIRKKGKSTHLAEGSTVMCKKGVSMNRQIRQAKNRERVRGFFGGGGGEGGQASAGLGGRVNVGARGTDRGRKVQ